MSGDRFDLELERVRLRAMLAVERLSAALTETVIARLGTELAQVDQALASLTASDGRAEALARRLGLSSSEMDLVWAAVAATTDPRLLPHLQMLGGNEARRGLSLAVYVQIAGLDGPRARALTVSLLGPHPLLRHQLLSLVPDGQSPSARPLLAAPRLCAWLSGNDEPDEALQGAAEVVAPVERPERDDTQRAMIERVRHVLGSRKPPLLVLEGPPGTGRRSAMAAVGRELGHEVVALDVKRLPPRPADFERALSGLRRECLLRDAIPLIADLDEMGELDGDSLSMRRALARALDEIPGPAAMTTVGPGVELPSLRPVVRLRYGVPDAATRRALWRSALAREPAGEGGPTTAPRDGEGGDLASDGDGDDGIDVDLLATRYRLGPGGIRRAVGSARLLAGDGRIELGHLVAGVRSNIAERLGDLAQRIEVRQSWDDLILAPDLKDQATALISRVRHARRVLEDWGFSDKLPLGTGVAALFSGPPGTGKTMLAGLVARELELELYQVDLSKVISKWVGETEKQLARIFEAADAGHALLLFDEADSLFSRRTEVKSAIDRYANLEVNYLLQRIESFGGVTVLTTNLEASIDPALRRRLACHIAFWPPDVEERDRLWRRMLASKAPMADGIDVSLLARSFAEMTGANVRNAVLSAAFLAAAEGSPITQQHLERAARGEYAAMGRVLRGS